MNERDSIVSICVSDDCPACLLSIDSYHSDIPEHYICRDRSSIYVGYV